MELPLQGAHKQVRDREGLVAVSEHGRARRCGASLENHDCEIPRRFSRVQFMHVTTVSEQGLKGPRTTSRESGNSSTASAKKSAVAYCTTNAAS